VIIGHGFYVFIFMREVPMELQIQDLVSSIRKEGIEVANAEAESILAEAKKKAELLLASAKAEAQQNKEAMEKEIAILKESAAVSAEQAKRDAVLAFKSEIQEEFQKILSVDIGKVVSGEALGSLIRAAVSGQDVSELVAEVTQVSDGLKAELAKEIKEGLEIRPGKNVQKGFRLAAKDGSGYFDCSDEGIMEMLMPYFRNLDFQ
jgi:V/A-type H+-transporting ATPase subunit E